MTLFNNKIFQNTCVYGTFLLYLHNKKETINKYGMLRLDYLKAHKKALYTTLLMKDELTNHLVSVSKDAETLLNNLMDNYKITAEEIILNELIYTENV